MNFRSDFVDMTPLLDPVQALIIMSDDTVLTKQIQETHAPDGREINCPKFFQIIEEILYRATPLGIQAAMPEESKPSDSDSNMLEALSYLVGKISDEMAYTCMANADAHATTVSLLQILSSFNWDAKLVLLLAAFVLNYGEFWLHIQIHASNKLARKVSMLKQAPELDKLKEQSGELNRLIMLILDLAKCVVGFTELPFESKDLPELSTARGTFPAAIYWATRGIVFAAYTTLQYASSTLSSGTWEKELSQLFEKMNNINKRLQDQLTVCYKIIEEKRENDAYELLTKTIETVHIDNLKVLGPLLSSNEDEPLLVECPTRRTVNLEALRNKYVLLLISGLIESTSNDFVILNRIYVDSKIYSGVRGGFEIVWIPIVESRQITEDATQKMFINIQASMPWCSVPRLNSISNPVKKFIKEKFRYRNWPILVVLDPHGKVSNHNAFHMMWIWGSFGFPFTGQREIALWQEVTWMLPLIVNSIDSNIIEWMGSEKYIILYGGDDMQWITLFTATARRVAQAGGIALEMIYVGKNHKQDNELKFLVDAINRSRLSNSLQEIAIWFFWTRLESMLLSKVQLETNDEHETVMQEIEKLLMYDGIGTWALFSKGIDVSFTGHGPIVLHALQKFDEWKDNMVHRDFLVALKEEYDQLVGADHPCCNWVFDETEGMVPKSMVCPDCHQPMKQYAIYSCSHGP